MRVTVDSFLMIVSVRHHEAATLVYSKADASPI